MDQTVRSPNEDPVDVLRYEDYRAYLSDYVAWKRRTTRAFTVRQFCLKASITTENYLLRILRGQRNLGPALGERMIPVLGLTGIRADYFRSLVSFHSARSSAEQASSSAKLHQIRRAAGALAVVSDNAMFKRWYVLAIWELASCRGFNLTPKSAVRALKDQISVQEAKETIEFLVTRGYLVERNGTLGPTDITVMSSDGKPDPIVRLSHRETVGLALQAIDLPFESRGFFGLTIALDRKRVGELKDRIRKFTEELNAEFALDPKADMVYRVNAHCFPLADSQTGGAKR